MGRFLETLSLKTSMHTVKFSNHKCIAQWIFTNKYTSVTNYHDQNIEYCQLPRRLSGACFQEIPRKVTNILSTQISFLVLELPINGISLYISFRIWLLSFNNILSILLRLAITYSFTLMYNILL